MRVVRARPWWWFQNIHVKVRIGTPCHSIAPSSLIVYELFTKLAQKFCRQKSWHLGKIVLNISKFSPRHDTHYFTWRASPRSVTSSSLAATPNCVPRRKPFVVPVSVRIGGLVACSTSQPRELSFFLVNPRESQLTRRGSEAEEFWKQMASVFMTSQVCLIDDDQSVKQSRWKHQRGDEL